MSDPLGLINSTSGAGAIRPAMTPKASGTGNGPSFSDVLMKNIEQVNKLQQDAEKAIEDVASGRRDDVDGVLIAKQKADMAFQMLLQVRNKMVDAYEEIKQMRV
jgi:flagellar hook-basal body complex protein FliE